MVACPYSATLTCHTRFGSWAFSVQVFPLPVVHCASTVFFYCKDYSLGCASPKTVFQPQLRDYSQWLRKYRNHVCHFVCLRTVMQHVFLEYSCIAVFTFFCPFFPHGSWLRRFQYHRYWLSRFMSPTVCFWVPASCIQLPHCHPPNGDRTNIWNWMHEKQDSSSIVSHLECYLLPLRGSSQGLGHV